MKVKCPDDGTCHHDCISARDPVCVRVLTCGPLPGTFPGDRWPDGTDPRPLADETEQSRGS